MSMLEIVERPISVPELIDRVRRSDCGAVVTFLGVVRETDEAGRMVEGLAYEAYPPMALDQMNRIASEVHENFDPCRITIVHRVGFLGVGETSVAIVVAAPHRARAFAACEYAIDEFKARVEVWKKEQYVDGGSRWVENCRHP